MAIDKIRWFMILSIHGLGSLWSVRQWRLHPLSPARMACCWHLAAKTWLRRGGFSGQTWQQSNNGGLRIKHWDLAMKSGDWIIKNCDLIIKRGNLTYISKTVVQQSKTGNLILKHGDLFSHEAWCFFTHEQLGLNACKEKWYSPLPEVFFLMSFGQPLVPDPAKPRLPQ